MLKCGNFKNKCYEKCRVVEVYQINNLDKVYASQRWASITSKCVSVLRTDWMCFRCQIQSPRCRVIHVYCIHRLSYHRQANENINWKRTKAKKERKREERRQRTYKQKCRGKQIYKKTDKNKMLNVDCDETPSDSIHLSLSLLTNGINVALWSTEALIISILVIIWRCVRRYNVIILDCEIIRYEEFDLFFSLPQRKAIRLDLFVNKMVITDSRMDSSKWG